MLLINSFPKTRINDIIAPAGNVQTKRSYSYPSSRFSPLILLRSADLRSLPPDQLTPWPLCYARGGVSSQKKPGARRRQREHPAERLKEIPKKLSDRGVLCIVTTPRGTRQGQCPPPPLHTSGDVTTLPLTNKCSQYSNCTPVKSLISNKVFSEKKMLMSSFLLHF